MPCRHDFSPSKVPQYEACKRCGSYHSLSAADPATIYTDDYWSSNREHSTLEDQVYNVNVHQEHGVTKNDFVRHLIWTQDRSSALEIGCAPGILLRQLVELSGFESVTGIEAHKGYADGIRKIAGDKPALMFGLFPETLDGKPEAHSLVVALDVFEHSHDPAGFISACSRTLKQDGQLLLMLPLASADLKPDSRFFYPKEHVWIHSPKHMITLLEDAGFTGIKFFIWTTGHETVSARKL